MITYNKPSWLQMGARIVIKSMVFGTVKAIITSVGEQAFSYHPEKHGRDYSCSITFSNMQHMLANNEIVPVL